MSEYTFRQLEPASDLKHLAGWFTVLEEFEATEAGLQKFYANNKERCYMEIATGPDGLPAAFYWVDISKSDPLSSFLYLYTVPEKRRAGLGTRLFTDMLQQAEARGIHNLRTAVDSQWADGTEFAAKHGFIERSSRIGMELELLHFDDSPYLKLIKSLEKDGFRFTSMEELGNGKAEQQRLYTLNDATASDTPGSEGLHPWDSFEDFRQRVCEAEWYKPDGQMVVIEKASGAWVAMSAITQMKGEQYGYNLHTGVDRAYRGRKLAQAVKVTALRYARDALQVSSVRTHHNSKNMPMIAIDLKFGYHEISRWYNLEKML